MFPFIFLLFFISCSSPQKSRLSSVVPVIESAGAPNTPDSQSLKESERKFFFVTTDLKDKIFSDPYSGSFSRLAAHLREWKSKFGAQVIPVHTGELHENTDSADKPIRDTVESILDSLRFQILPPKTNHTLYGVPIRRISDPHQNCEFWTPGQNPEQNPFLPPKRTTKSEPQGLCESSLLREPYRSLDEKFGFSIITGGGTFIGHWGEFSPFVATPGRSQGYMVVAVSPQGKVIEVIGPIFTPNRPSDLSRLQEVALFGRELSEDNETKAALNQAQKLHQDLLRDPVGTLPSGPTRAKDAVADAIRQALRADVGIVPAGFFGQNPKSENIDGWDLFSFLPEDDRVELLELKGSTVRTLLEVATSGSREQPTLSGITLDLSLSSKRRGKYKDLNKNQRFDPWERNRIFGLRLTDPSRPFLDKETYTVAVPEEILKGCDDFGSWSKLPEVVTARRSSSKSLPSMRNAFRKYLKQVID